LEIGNWNDGMMESCLPSDWDGILTYQVSKACGRQNLLGLTASRKIGKMTFRQALRDLDIGYWILDIGNWNDGMMEPCLPSDWDGILTCQVSKACG
jgi:hypothetical protein